MSKFLRRAASVVLALSLAAGLVPAGISDLIGLPKTEVRADDVIEIATLEQMEAAIQSGGNYILTANIEITGQSENVYISSNLVLNLNGYRLKHDKRIEILTGGSLTVRDTYNGTGVIEGIGINADIYLYGGTLRLEDGIISAPYSTYCIDGNSGIDVSSSFIMTGGTVNEAAYYALRIYGGNNTYSISGGTLEGTIQRGYSSTGTYSVEITGGRFRYKPHDSFLPAGYEFVGPDSDGYYTAAHGAYDINLTGGTDYASVSGAVSQTDVNGEMDPVTYTANDGYHFDEYRVTESGITIARTSETTITVSGTPTADVDLRIPEAVADTAYSPLLVLRADSSKVYLDIRIPYVNGESPTVTWGGSAVALTPESGDAPTYGYFTIDCAIKNMTDTKTLTVTYGGNQLYSGDISVASYLRYVITHYPNTAYSNTAIALLRYGAAAQLVFDYPTGVQENTPAIANYGIPEAQLSTLNDVVVPDTTPVSDIASVFERLRYSTYYGMNMTHTYDTVLLIAFRVNENENIGTAVQEVRMSYFPDESAWTVTADSTHHYVIVKINVGVREMETSVYTYTRVPGNIQTCILPSDYLGRISADSSRNMNLRYLCRALYLYYQAAVNIPAN